MKKIPGKRGPKTKHKTDKIDPVEVEKLAMMACTAEEMADFFDVSVDTIDRNFADALKRGRSKGKMSMKRALFEKLLKGDLGAMVWWGKNFAGMSDKVEQKQEISMSAMTDEQLEQLIKEALRK